MTAELVAIADAVRADLALGPTIDAAGTATAISGEPARISHALSVQRVYVPRFSPPDQTEGAYQVLVSPGGEETERIARRTLQATYAVEIGICAKLANTENATVDAALQVLQEMGDYFFDYGLTGELAQWVRNDVLVWPDREHLATNLVLFALWTATFVGTRE